MKTMTAIGMGSEMILISFIWITAFIIVPGHSQFIPKIKNLDCVNDYDKTMVCFWEVENEDTNCSLDFQLKYTDFTETSKNCTDIYNEYDKNSRVPSKCVCNIKVEAFIADENYVIEVVSDGQSIASAKIHILSSLKPKRPTNVSVDVTDPENGVVHWKSHYEQSSVVERRLSYHIQFIDKEDDKEFEDNSTRIEPRYMFSKRHLTRGHEYKVRVRTRITHSEQTKEIWSEWSPESEFKNDYSLTTLESLQIIIPVSSVIILLLIVSCYFCITRAKEKWWNNIPDPAKSKLAESKLIQKHSSKPAGKYHARESCSGNCLSQLVKAHKKSKQEPFTKEQPVKECVSLVGNNMKTIVFEPEKVDIEIGIQLYPRKDDKLYLEDLPEDKEEDFHLMANDLSIGRMFCDILCDSSGQVEALEQLNGVDSFGGSILRDHFYKTDRHLPLSMVSQESGYQSYDSDDSPGDSKLDGPNALYFDHPLSQGDFLPYAPASSIKESGCQMEDVLLNSGYNSFANALAEATSNIVEGDNISVFSLDTMFCNSSYHHSLQNPKSVLYYNIHSFPTPHENDLRPTMTPISDHTIETCPTSVSEVPGYQSFNQAVQQGDMSTSTTCPVYDPGYKPFECLTNISTNSLDNIGGFLELDISCPYQDSVEDNEDLPKTGMVNSWIHPWNNTQSSNFNMAEFNFFERKYPFYSRKLGDEHKGSGNCYGIGRTLTKANKPLALTFDISDHIRNFANIYGLKMSMGLEFVEPPSNPLSYPSSPGKTPNIHNDLTDKDCLHTEKDFPMKFENKAYFAPLCHSRASGYSQTKSHLLEQQNNMDEEGNLYMKITLL
ncbi:interleukin-4 receptor subunit alpha-like isoform X2 [Dendropsophus ebraccatus]|uniref:interleukin-4 receptor subunit alpha-like isoform X2 n=1 Tax=Dendropsophus ebraccatus TaxID=150705 RepID=UPI003831548C